VRTLTATLLAAQKAAVNVPFVLVKAVERVQGHVRLMFTESFVDGAAPDDEHDADFSATHLQKVRMRAGRPQHQRLSAAPWGSSTWVDLNVFNDGAHVSVGANGARVIVAYNRGNNLHVRESTDNGGTFGSETLAYTGAATMNALAIAVKSSGDACIVFSENNVVKRVRRVAAAWGAALNSTSQPATCNGIAVVVSGDFHVVLTGTEPTTLYPTVWTQTLGDGFAVAVDTWTALAIYEQADVESTITFQAPHLTAVPSERMAYVEKHAGSVSYTRVMTTRFPPVLSFAANAWHDPQPVDDTAAQGLALAASATLAYLARPGRTLTAPVTPAERDLSADLVYADWREDGLGGSGRFLVQNDGGAYADPAGALTEGDDLEISPGYVTTAGNDVSAGPAQTIVAINHVRDGRVSFLEIRTGGADHWLERSRHRRTQVLSGKTPAQLVRFLAGRAGLDLSDAGASSRALNYSISAWAVHPDQARTVAVREVLDLVADLTFWRSGSVFLTEPVVGDAVDYTFGVDHAVYRARTVSELRASMMEVIGVGHVGQSFDFAEQLHDRPIMDRRRDPHGAAASDVIDHAAARQRKAVLGRDAGELVVPPHCGIEVLDVVEYADALVSAANLRARVKGVRTLFDRRPGRAPVYQQTLSLGGV